MSRADCCSSGRQLLTFLLGLWAIRDGRDGLYAVVLAVGAVNNETMLILPCVHFFYHVDGFGLSGLSRVAASTLATSIPAFTIWGAIRVYTWDQPYLGGGALGSTFSTNLEGMSGALDGLNDSDQ